MRTPRFEHGLKRAILAIALLACVAAAPEGAEEHTSDYRIVGLFSPDRVDDLKHVMADIPEIQLSRLDYEAARVTLQYDLKVLFPDHNPKKPPSDAEIEQRLNNLLNTASYNTFSLKPLPTVAEGKLAKIAFPVGILDCKGCRYAAYLAVTKAEGVERATVTTDRMVTAWIDPTKTDRPALEAALKKANIGQH